MVVMTVAVFALSTTDMFFGFSVFFWLCGLDKNPVAVYGKPKALASFEKDLSGRNRGEGELAFEGIGNRIGWSMDSSHINEYPFAGFVMVFEKIHDNICLTWTKTLAADMQIVMTHGVGHTLVVNGIFRIFGHG